MFSANWFDTDRVQCQLLLGWRFAQGPQANTYNDGSAPDISSSHARIFGLCLCLRPPGSASRSQIQRFPRANSAQRSSTSSSNEQSRQKWPAVSIMLQRQGSISQDGTA